VRTNLLDVNGISLRLMDQASHCIREMCVRPLRLVKAASAKAAGVKAGIIETAMAPPAIERARLRA
jgi:hypothetical protein